ncbi:MAG: hypothetical protein K5641_09245 [Lachnospiraceae bacterium]|nr:hypothetical protein [Lachnospiraceae bacterium]
MLSLSIPAILGMVVIGLYNFMDAVFVGRMVGPEAMTAVKVSYPFTLLNSGISTLIGTGSASVLSRAIGKGGNAAILTLLRQIILFLPLVLSLPYVFVNSVEGVFYAQLFTDLIVLCIGAVLMIRSLKDMQNEQCAPAPSGSTKQAA